MGTSAQNAGRYKAYERADALGVKLTIEWQATLDDRTRHDHRMMHGQRRDVGEPFITPDGYSILWPADSSSDYTDAPQSEIWNCRCTLLSWVKGFEGDTITSSPKMGEMSFEEWQQDKAPAEEVQSYYKPLDADKFVNETFTAEDVERINSRFAELDSVYHADVSNIVTSLERDQQEYDILHENYVNSLLENNPRMRRSTAEKKADELLGERPKKASLFLGGDFNPETMEMTLNNQCAFLGGGISEDIQSRIKHEERNERRILSGRDVRDYANAGQTAEAAFIHEYGHAIGYTYGVTEDSRFLDFYHQFSKEDIESGLSVYGATNEKEFIAECFLESFMGETQGQISKDFMVILKEIIG